MPDPSACCRGTEKGARRASRTDSDGLAAEPADHALGRSRGGLTTELRLAVDASMHVLAVVVTASPKTMPRHTVRHRLSQ
ncbi:hypothetical protein GCM10010398_62840 [Streptomyces fimbriatus]